MRFMKVFRLIPGRRSRGLAVSLVVCIGCLMLSAGQAFTQALTVAVVGEGTEVILVTEPFMEMAVACWPDGGEAACVSGTDLVFLGDLEEALAGSTAPAALVVVGGSTQSDVIDLMRRIVGDQPAAPAVRRRHLTLSEGGLERRLGPPGTDASLRLQVPMPPADSPQRSAMTVLWNLLPRALGGEHPGLRARTRGDLAELELSVENESPNFALRRLRLSLARLGADPNLKAEVIEGEAYRLRIARRARLEQGKVAALELLELWASKGASAVREHLFGLDGVTLSSVEDVARDWLAQHPGHAVVVLPPHVFRPRFVPAPHEIQLENDVTTAVLERPGAGLSTLVLRPVFLSGLGGDAESVILTRVAGLLRARADRPPFIAVEASPPRLELAAAEEDFPMLCESLQEALETIAEDETEVSSGDDARSRALRLMSGVLGLDTGTTVTPARALTPGNLAIGVVAPDSESAIESLQKFGIGGPPHNLAPVGSAVDGSPRRRMPATGTTAAVVIAGEIAADFPVSAFLEIMIERRIKEFLEKSRVEVFSPLVPGRSMLVVVVESEQTVEDLEAALLTGWQDLMAPVDEAELAGLRRAVATEIISLASGVLGRARACADVAAGVDRWRSPSEKEMAAMTIEVATVNLGLVAVSDPTSLEWTASGPLPVTVSP